jgi:hypothetical protein
MIPTIYNGECDEIERLLKAKPTLAKFWVEHIREKEYDELLASGRAVERLHRFNIRASITIEGHTIQYSYILLKDQIDFYYGMKADLLEHIRQYICDAFGHYISHPEEVGKGENRLLERSELRV